MGNEIVQANYPDLENIASQFGSLNESAAAMQANIRRAFEPLAGGGWIGRGSEAFVAEMDSEMFPAIERMIQALEAGRAVTTEISNLLHQAEEEAASVYKGDPFGGGAGGTGGGGAGGGGASGAGGGGGGGGSLNGPTGAFNPSLSVKSTGVGLNLFNGSLFSAKAEGQKGIFGGSAEVKAGTGAAGIRFGKDDKGKFTAGAYASASVLEASANGRIGSKDWGATGGVSGKALSADAFAGYKDGTIGASIGGTLASAKGEVGTNIAGTNVSVNGEIGLKLEAGISIGKNTQVKLGPVSFGFSFGKGK